MRLQLGSKPVTGSLPDPTIDDGNKERIFGRNKPGSPEAADAFAEDNAVFRFWHLLGANPTLHKDI